MFNFFKKRHAYQNVTETVNAISQFLIDDAGSDIPTPFKEFLDSKNLDFSLESLKAVDFYLNEVRKRKVKLNQDQLIKVVARCGAYCGEVVRRNSKKNFYWITYDTATSVSQKGKFFVEKSIYTFYILFAEPENFCFPLAKVGKFLDSGSGESLWGLASMVLEQDGTVKV